MFSKGVAMPWVIFSSYQGHQIVAFVTVSLFLCVFNSPSSWNIFFTTWDGEYDLLSKNRWGEDWGPLSNVAIFFPQHRCTILFWILELPNVNFYLSEVFFLFFNFISYCLQKWTHSYSFYSGITPTTLFSFFLPSFCSFPV